MISKLRVVCHPAVRDGFALAGVRSMSAVDAHEAALVLDTLLQQPDVGVILVEESLYRALPEETRHPLERRAIPIVVPFPGPRRAEEQPSAEADLVELLRSAIGYRVRLR